METKIIIGFFIGVLCGIVPLCFGFLKNSRVLGIIGAVMSAAAGTLFNVLDKPPFTALFVAILFVVIIIANNKRRSKAENDEIFDDLDQDID